MQIPNLYHFVWMGESRPYYLIIAIQSVLLRCRDAQVVLWVDLLKENEQELEQLKKAPLFSIKRINFEELLSDSRMTELGVDFPKIFRLAGSGATRTNTKPIERSRSNLVRYIILYLHGGVYLDADTLVLRNLSPLLQGTTAFMGKENMIWPILKRKNPLHRFIWAPFLEVVRFICVQLPSGYRFNHMYRALCGAAVNNAVLGFGPQHPYLKAVFTYIATMPSKEVVRPLRLGPFLLQQVSKTYRSMDVKTYGETYFYPFGPLFSQHYFKKRQDAAKVSAVMIPNDCYVVHWGASTKLLKENTRISVVQNPNTSVFNHLCFQVVNTYADGQN